MLLNLKKLYKEYNLNIKGVIHIGAHYGEENSLYDNLNIKNKIFFEPNKESFNILKNNIKDNSLLYNMGLGNFSGETILNLSSNRNASASILTPNTHLKLHPNVKFKGVEKINIDKLDNVHFNRDNYNMINMDVQGYELEVLKGSIETLNNIDYIITEVNKNEVYHKCPHIDDITSFLTPYGFFLKEVNWAGVQWGDAFYVKK